LVRWEKTLGLFEERTAVNDDANRPVPETKPAVNTPPARRPKKPVASVMRPAKQSEPKHNFSDSQIGQALDAL